MLPPARNDSCSGNPTPEMLAGIYVEIAAEEDFSVLPRLPPDSSSAGHSPEQPPPAALAGVCVHVEAPEDLSVRPLPGA